MAPKRNSPSASAELSLVQLQRCLVNLPPSLVALLVNLDTPAQNVIVELSYRDVSNSGSDGKDRHVAGQQQSVYVGWTGMPSKRKVAPIVSRDGLNGTARGGGAAAREQEVALVEIDSVLATALGLHEGQRVDAIVHVDPPLAHTVSIEPLTPEDWEIIELHATFLEFNFLNQIRALPNPAYLPNAGTPIQSPHPLVLHLSPTTTAKIKVLSMEPAPPSESPFAKIAPEAEVIVAPKSRAKPQRLSKENRSVTSNSKRSGKSAASTVKRKGGKDDHGAALYLRPIDARLCDDLLEESTESQSFTIWVDEDVLLGSKFRGIKWVKVSIIRPSPLQRVQGTQEAGNQIIPSQSLIAQLRPWEDAPSDQAVAVSTSLCAAFGSEGIVGGVVKLELAPSRIARKGYGEPPRDSVQRLKIYPYLPSSSSPASSGIKFGGESKAEKDSAANMLKLLYGGHLLNGPLVDGTLLPVYDGLDHPFSWEGGILRFDPPPSIDAGQPRWILGSEWNVPLDLQPPIPRASPSDPADHALTTPIKGLELVGVDPLLNQLRTHLLHMSSVLLTGGLGAGKSSIARSVCQDLRSQEFYHVSYLSCMKLSSDESRVSTIKDTLNSVFMEASWGARLGGKSIVILDDLDKLCPVETELQVGNDNSRSRQMSETVCSVVRQYCGRQGNVVLLATSQSKDSLHNVILAGHVVRDIVEIKAPDKETRRTMMETIVMRGAAPARIAGLKQQNGSRPATANNSVEGDDGWMDASSRGSRHDDLNDLPDMGGFLIDPGLDMLELAGLTDGYMPADLLVLHARARNEALIRAVGEEPSVVGSDVITLSRKDFDKALDGFTPAALRNVTLQSSTVTFDSIGGLKDTRQVLLETLQYPTTYAPLFAQCPLRLRSGLLLYGYPGCGKTLLASAVAGECGLNFISVKGPEILNKYIGASEKAVRDLFERAQAARPCVLFFDEFDSIAPKRGHDSTGVTDRVVNQLLTQMDGAEGLSGVYVLAATSRPDLIDPALLRPGRLDKSLLCDFPNLADRIDILRALAKKVKLHDEVLESEDDLLDLARRTDGFSGADMQALVSNAQLEAIHEVLQDDNRSRTAGTRGSAVRRPEHTDGIILPPSKRFIQFRYGANEATADGELGNTTNRQATELAEQAAIAAKLDGLKLARRKAKQRRAVERGAGQGSLDGADINSKGQGKGTEGEVVIGWRHLIGALENTRASISVNERRRLERIYHDFVVGRSGEMRDGQASMEIGGRSSLM